MATAVTTMWSSGVVRGHLKATATTHDTQIERFADGVSARIQSYIRRRIVTQSVTEILNGTCSNKIQLPDYPVSALTEVKLRASMLEGWSVPLVLTGTGAQVELDSKHGIVYLLGNVVSSSIGFVGIRTISVIYVAGWGAQDNAAIPRDLYSTGLDYVKFLYNRWANDLIITSSTSAQGRNATVPQDLPKDVKDAIEHYVKRRI